MEMWRTGGGRETLYGSCISRAKEASRHGRIAGILWYQGESDAFSEKAAQDWNTNFVKHQLSSILIVVLQDEPSSRPEQ